MQARLRTSLSSRLQTWLLRNWQERGAVACLLWPLSKLFQLIVTFRFGVFVLGYKPQTRLPVPVIIVGNIFVGGTGKTPLVIWLVKQLQAAGWRPGVISRGYGAHADSVTMLDAHSSAAIVGDEPLLIAQHTGAPVAVGRDRVAVAHCLMAAQPETDVLISDDGLQHYFLARDVEIMLFDERGVGNGWMLPAGPLREPVNRRRDFTVLNAALDMPLAAIPGMPADVERMQLVPQFAYQLGHASVRQALSAFTSANIVAAAGIGNPQRFFTMLSGAGVRFASLPLADHFQFDADTFSQVDADCILITEKDAVKCRQIPSLHNDERIWVVPVVAQLDEQFATDLLQLISEKKHGHTPA
ncbi:tetraacyldisaccharide 4'-kinase [Undibacterium sp. RuRC25W]|uniref:tetraacyldisaccharide 4'-kinase n=1 Tax=Undibacterium sp. RuRC25W TaxID=3413047 RepID=UPI003BEF77BA